MSPDGLATPAASISVGLLLTFVLVGLVVAVFYIAVMWKVFTKAGQPGWAAIIPIYNTYVLCKVAGRPGWWVLLFFIPIVDFVILIILCLDIARMFGKSGAFGFFGLFMFSFIGFPILAYGSARYQGPTGPGYGQPGGYGGNGGGYQPGYPPMHGYPPHQGYQQQPQGYQQPPQGYNQPRPGDYQPG